MLYVASVLNTAEQMVPLFTAFQPFPGVGVLRTKTKQVILEGLVKISTVESGTGIIVLNSLFVNLTVEA